MSYTHGEGTQSLVYTTLGCLLDRRAAECPDKAAHVFRGTEAFSAEDPSTRLSPRREVLTFGELSHRSLVLASKLLDCGLRTGDRIAIIGNNCPEWLYLEYATLRLGVVLVRIPGNLVTADMLTMLLKKYNCQVLVFDPCTEILKKIDRVYLPGILSDTQEAIKKHGLPLKHVFFMRDSTSNSYPVNSLASMMQEGTSSEATVREVQQTLSPDDATILYPTSGSEGFPKFPAHSHFAIINTCLAICRQEYNCEEENCVVFNDRPFTWLGSLLMTSVVGGVTMVHTEGANTRIVLQIMEEEHVTSAALLTYILHDAKMLVDSGVKLPPLLQNVLTGGEQIPDDIIAFANNHFKSLKISYGGSESLGTAVGNCKEFDSQEHWLYPMPLIEFKIINENKRLVPIGEVERLLVRSQFITRGYEGGVETTVDVRDSAGWFDTGDIGKLNAKGQLLVMGRSRDVISKGATKIYPVVIERVLAGHPKVDKVAVIGVPDARLFNEICACIIPKQAVELSETELEKFSRQSFIDVSTNLIPKYFWVTETFPLGTTGKVSRKDLTAMAIQKFRLG